jgi:hypothetical protein
MKHTMLIAVLLFVVLAGCKKDDSTTVTPPAATDPIVGTWLMEGANVPYGLMIAPFKVIRIRATFNADNTYTVVQTDSSNTQTTFTGTYTKSASTYTDTVSTSRTKTATINNIVANQATPSTVTSTGIYAILGTYIDV